MLFLWWDQMWVHFSAASVLCVSVWCAYVRDAPSFQLTSNQPCDSPTGVASSGNKSDGSPLKRQRSDIPRVLWRWKGTATEYLLIISRYRCEIVVTPIQFQVASFFHGGLGPSSEPNNSFPLRWVLVPGKKWNWKPQTQTSLVHNRLVRITCHNLLIHQQCQRWISNRNTLLTPREILFCNWTPVQLVETL